ncbi:MAG: MBL fold metallo-hydrolase [Chlamydiae bacterium]|nr:MBL fold metallo-hydrolase [Chlamydiota bacterium]
MIGICPLASGSKGNCIYIGTERTKILIDAGISVRTIANRLGEIGVDLKEIDAIIITHEHADHISGLQMVSSKFAIPIFTNSDTAKAIYDIFGTIPKLKIFSTGEDFEFGDLLFHPFSVQHDALDPIALTIQFEEIKIGICTDLGFVSASVIHQLKECDYLYVEANHEPSMVYACSRPDIYKERVLSRQGHLSNHQCAELIEAVFHEKLKHVYLAHLSSECNSPELALKIVQEKLMGKNISISIAHQDQRSEMTQFEERLKAKI